MAARQGAPVLGAHDTSYLPAESFQLNFGYRWQRSDRHFRGDKEETHRAHEHSEVINDIHLLDFGLAYAVTERLNLSVNLPVLIAERSQPIRNSQRQVIGRTETHARGIGDLSLLSSYWLLDTETHRRGNIAIGLGVKFPTGRDNVRDNFRQADGSLVRRSVDQSIQPGDGGYGAVVDVRAFQQVHDLLTLYLAGSYLFNPQNKNHTYTGRRRPGEEEMSIADQFVGRAGLALAIAPEHGWTLTLGARAEGVPSRDLIGASDGFRRPGIAVSIEPGLIYTLGRHTFSLSVPVAVYRNRFKSVPDRRADPDRHGDAAFADFLVLFGYSVRFDAPWNWGKGPPGDPPGGSLDVRPPG